MNYMQQVAHILGVELYECFGINATKYFAIDYYLDTDGLQIRKSNNRTLWFRVVDDITLTDLICGKYKIIKRPWKPKDGDTYWYMWIADGEPIYEDDVFDHSSVSDIAFLAFGNCFRTRKEAEAHKDEILEKMQEVLEG